MKPLSTISLLCTYRCLPNLERTSAQQTIVHRLHQVPTEAKQVLDSVRGA